MTSHLFFFFYCTLNFIHSFSNIFIFFEVHSLLRAHLLSDCEIIGSTCSKSFVCIIFCHFKTSERRLQWSKDYRQAPRYYLLYCTLSILWNNICALWLFSCLEYSHIHNCLLNIFWMSLEHFWLSFASAHFWVLNRAFPLIFISNRKHYVFKKFSLHIKM